MRRNCKRSGGRHVHLQNKEDDLADDRSDELHECAVAHERQREEQRQREEAAQEQKLQQLVQLTQLDRSGRINIDSLLDAAANNIDPVLADRILQPTEAAFEQVVNQVTDDLSKIFAGIEMPARPNGAQIAMQVIEQYVSQPDVASRLQSDESFRARIEKYVGQYTFQMQQSQNAQIGRVGTEPAQMGNIQTQGV